MSVTHWSCTQSFPQTHVIVDYTCEVEENGAQTLQGVGVTTVSLRPESAGVNITDTFHFLSNAELQCNCYDFRNAFPPAPEFICRHIVTRCPYTLQGINGTISF